MTQELNTGSIGANSTMPHFASEAYGQSSTMAASLIEDGCADATLPHFNIAHCTGIRPWLFQAAALQPPARKTDFDGVPRKFVTLL
jgi:hypothetical protein